MADGAPRGAREPRGAPVLVPGTDQPLHHRRHERALSQRPADRPAVLLVVKFDAVGGVERNTATLVAALGRRGVSCDLVTVERFAGPGLLTHLRPTALDVRVARGPVRRLLQRRLLRRIIRARDYRAVIAFGPTPNALVSLARGRGGPTIVVAENGDPFIARRRRWNRWWMWTYRRADVLVAQTDRVAAELRATRRTPDRVVVIPYMVSPDLPRVDPATSRQSVIAGVGRLVPSKRNGDLVQALARLGSAADGWRIVLVGDGPERAPLQQLAGDLGIGKRMEFTGWREAPWEILAESSVFVLCSENEGFPTVLLEAMASGCAIVASDCRFGPREILGDGECGLLYPVGDIGALARSLAGLIADQERRLALARAAHERVGDFSEEVVVGRWLEVTGL
jgi:GalNAc-alpha-(1->4)-GalNAc-alpha-(1->3)-diNAcBac-PP-undecaprenol alpha-1,4-N-acetyl-D-galactosaminyltransferase